VRKYRARLLAIGNELTAGKIVDSNSAFLASRLSRLGIEVVAVSVLRDRLDEIEPAIKQAVEAAEVVFTTGGLGPTSDDLTRNAVAAAANVGLEENSSARQKLEQLFATRKRPMNENNLRQVQFPSGAEVITNSIGTADAFVTRISSTPVISLPGVPIELQSIFDGPLSQWLQTHLPSPDGAAPSFYWRCFGCSESYLGRQIESCSLPEEIEVSYRPMFPEILLTFTHRGSAAKSERAEALQALQPMLVSAIGEEFIVSKDEHTPLAAALLHLLKERNKTLAVAESCSGGLIGHLLTSHEGASESFSSSVVSYSNESKSIYLGVRPAMLKRYGAVSAEIAIEMARGVKYRTGSDFGLSITGIAGPGGGTEEKPVGTFYIGLATANKEESWHYFFAQERNLFRLYSAHLALDVVRRSLLGFPESWERK